jgi:2,4-dienoyl-CoA reductase-like NADH-dependent reductase (Old Yellow Enzyme family)/thioredoxin reductase
MTSIYPTLFSPIEVGRNKIRNRVVLPATLTNFAQSNRITERWHNFLVERSRGGAGMIVSEIIAVDPEAIAHGGVVTGFDDSNDQGFRDVAGSVHDGGAVLVGQLWHPGRQQLWHPTKSPMGVSEQPDDLSWTVPHVMSTTEVERVARAYIEVAERLRHCGFAGVELHGAHGYLIGQFLSPRSNTRNDEYGGGVAGRSKFVREVANGIRRVCGDGFIVGLKMPGDEGVKGGIDVTEAERITGHLAETGDFDYFAYGQGNFSLSLENHVPDLYFRPGHFIDIPKRLRRAAAGVPVIALGRVGEPALAEKIVAEGYGDMVGMCRAQIADAAWARKAESGKADDIRPSVFDNWCWGEIHAGKGLAEHHNPYLGRAGEAGAEDNLTPATRPLAISVIGAGPAGLEAAWVAASRSHDVTVFGASETVGGKLRLESELPGRADMIKIVNYQRRMCERYGVRFELGGAVAAETVLSRKPDAVVLASGAGLRRPANLPAETHSVLDGVSFVKEHARSAAKQAGTAVLFDQDHGPAVYGLADLMAQRFERLYLLTSRTSIAQNVNYCSAIGVHRRLYTAGVEIITAHEVTDFSNGDLTCHNVFSGRKTVLSGIELVVYVTPRLANDDMAAAFGDVPVYSVGDSQSPRNLLAAIHGGHILGNAL